MRVFFIFFAILPLALHGQYKRAKKQSAGAGNIFFYFGSSKTWYSKSTLNFDGAAYDFALKGVHASDGHSLITLPVNKSSYALNVTQCNAKMGYLLSDHYAVILDWNRCNYNLLNQQNIVLSGTIKEGIDQIGGLSGNYTNQSFLLDSSKLYIQLNALNSFQLQVNRFDDLVSYGKRNNRFTVSSFAGLGFGALASTSNFLFLGKRDYDVRSLSGITLSAQAGMRIHCFNYFFIQSDLSGGIMNQLSVRNRMNESNAFMKQKLGYLNYHLGIGVIFPVQTGSKCNTCPKWE
jgi:hypothetical protein